MTTHDASPPKATTDAAKTLRGGDTADPLAANGQRCFDADLDWNNGNTADHHMPPWEHRG